MLRQIAIFFLLFKLMLITSCASNTGKDEPREIYNQFVDQVNCELANYFIQKGGTKNTNVIDCNNCSDSSLIIQLSKFSNYQKIVKDLGQEKLSDGTNLSSLNIDSIIENYLSKVDKKANEVRPNNKKQWNDIINPIKKSYTEKLKERIRQIDSNKSNETTETIKKLNNIIEQDKKEIEKLKNEIEQKKAEPILTYILFILITILIILVVFLYVKQKEYKDEINKLKDTIDAKDRQINSLKKSSFSANSDQTTPSLKNNKTNSEILEAVLDGIRKKFINIPTSIVNSQINIKRASWLDKINNKFEGNSRISIDEKNQFILKHIEEDLVRAFDTDYYKKEQIEKLLDYQDILYSQDWLKRFRKISGQRLEEITKQKINEFKFKLPNDNLISKFEFDQNIVDLKKQVELTISEEESNMDTILYSSQPVSDGYFLIEKLSDELLGQHMYKILVSAKYPDSARFQFLFDNEKAMKTAIASYSTALVPVCKLEGDNTKGDRIVPYQENTYGTLRLENDRWKVQEKLRIKIV